jgi:hypothetical protein
MRPLLLLALSVALLAPAAPAASAGWVAVCGPAVGCIAGACALDCDAPGDPLLCFALGPTAPPVCLP